MPERDERIEEAGLSRRGFLGVGAAGALAATGAGAWAQTPLDVRLDGDGVRGGPRAKGAARNIVFLISDGMSAGTLTLADMLIRDRTGKPSRWIEWIRSAGDASSGVRRAMLATECADSLVTDSAAASTAWNIGERVNMGALNITPEWRAPEPLWPRARRMGKATGLVTTTRITHATPAGFVAHSPDRDLEDDIAQQMVAAEIDVLLGGGAKHFPDDLLRARGGLLVRDRESLLSATAQGGAASGRLLGLFTDGHMTFEVERPSTEPSLAEMTSAALRALERAPEGFALHVEGGRVDHAAHYNCPAGLLFDQAAFDEALGVALDWAKGRDPSDTLVIATTDHGNANPGLHDYGKTGRERFARVASMRRSTQWMLAQFKTLPPPERKGEALVNIVRHGAGFDLTPREVDAVERWLRGESVEIVESRNTNMGPLAAALTNHTGVAFLGPNHTADHVECTAWGPGSERIPSCAHLTDLRAVVEEAMGLPEMKTEQLTPKGKMGTAPD